MKIEELVNSREVKSTATSVMMSMIAHVAIIVTFALIFWPTIHRSSVSLTVQQPVNDMESKFESIDPFDEMDEMMDMAVFESSEFDEVEEFELEDESLDANEFDDSALASIHEMNSLTAAPPSRVEVSSSYTSGFFGIPATGNRIVYVIDISVSMAERSKYGNRYQRAVQHVMYSVEQLNPEQEFFVYLFCFDNFPMRFNGSGQFCRPTKQNIELLREWLESRRLGPGTDPRVSLVSALEMNPTTVFLLSDGEFNGVHFRNGKYRARTTTVRLAREHNKNNCPIHTVGLEDKNNQRDLKQISQDSNGVYQFVPADK